MRSAAGTFLSVAMLVSLAASGDRQRPPTTNETLTQTADTNARRDGASPAPSRLATPEQTNRRGESSFNQYKFTYERTGEQAQVSFAPSKLPWNDSLIVAAARQVIVAVYDDRSENFPRPVEWNYRGQQAKAIKLEGEKYEYVFLPVRDGNREVGTLVFWQLPKGTVR